MPGGRDGGTDARLSDPADLDATVEDLSASGGDLAALDLSRAPDLSALVDLRMASDLRPLSDLATPPDLGFASYQNVDIYVDNTCKMDVLPKKFDVPAGTFLKLTYFNRSRDYKVDVWSSYGGGFTDLMTGASWAERFEYCRYPRPYSAYVDVSTACSRYRLMINCL